MSKGRVFQSYVNEFCGMLGLASNTLKFMIDGSKRDYINPNKVMNSSCLIKVFHTQEFHSCPNNSLKPALKSVLMNELCSDM